MKARYLLVIMLTIISLLGCTDNIATRSFGGSYTKRLDCGHKLIMLSWKGDDLWTLTREMKEDEEPESYLYDEKSAFGAVEGQIIIKECKNE